MLVIQQQKTLFFIGNTSGNKVYTSKTKNTSRNTDVKVIPFWYYLHRHAFIGNTIAGSETQV